MNEVISTYALNEINRIKKFNILPIIGDFPGKVFENKEWDYSELKPYYRLIRLQELDAVILDNSINPKLDDKNFVTFSNFVIQNLLRDMLKFKGVVISADLKDKNFAQIPLKQRVIKAINAGVDMIFFSSYFSISSNAPKAIKSIILKAIRNGKISKSKIEESYKKIENLRGKLL